MANNRFTDSGVMAASDAIITDNEDDSDLDGNENSGNGNNGNEELKDTNNGDDNNASTSGGDNSNNGNNGDEGDGDGENPPKEPETPSEQPKEPQLNKGTTSGRVVFAVDTNGVVYFYAPVNPEKYTPEGGFNMEAIREDITKVFPEMADVEATDTKRWMKAMQEYSVLRFGKNRLPKELLLDRMARQ